MKKPLIDDSDNSELIELTLDSDQKIKLSPAEEYKKALKRRRNKRLLLILLLVEIAFSVFFAVEIWHNDLHYRVTKQLENNYTGQNILATGVYTGETDFGYFAFDATFEFTTGSTYEGQWDNNHMHGIGILNVPSEGEYNGEFILSQKNGVGTFTWGDGAIYDGEWKDDQMEGQGVYVSPDSVKYAGTFMGNRFQTGNCTFSNITGTYIAQYKEFVIDNLTITFPDGTGYDGATDGETISGVGTMQFSFGDKYTGSFAYGMRTGQGVYAWNNGDVYDGAWSSDSMTGTGRYTYADASYAQGEFEKNQFINGSYTIVNTFGEYTFTIKDGEAVAVEMVLTSGTTYSGGIVEGNLTGTAQIRYSNGDTYSGRVNDAYKSGQGTYIWSSGASYEGDWENDKMNGQGTYFYAASETGYKLTGDFASGVPDGECQYYVRSYESYKTDWTSGKCVKVYE